MSIISKNTLDGISQSVGKHTLLAKKHSPKVMFALGIAGVVTSTVLACRATLRLQEKVDKFKEDIDGVREMANHSTSSEYDRKEHNKDLIYIYSRNTYEIAKLYGPALVIGGLSIASLTGAHVTLTKRNTSLTAAYSALHLTFKEYRDRVRAELGEEREKDIYHGVVVETHEIDGKKQEIKVVNPNKTSPYAKFFDEVSPNWQKNPELNRLFVQCQQNYANHLLHARGHVFLNEVYDMLGLDRSRAGQVVGWVIGNGDNYIDFGIFETQNARFVNGYERSILLDFNVDGVIFDKI